MTPLTDDEVAGAFFKLAATPMTEAHKRGAPEGSGEWLAGYLMGLLAGLMAGHGPENVSRAIRSRISSLPNHAWKSAVLLMLSHFELLEDLGFRICTEE